MRLQIPVPTPGGEIHALRPVQQRDASVAEIDQKLGGLGEDPTIVNVQPEIVFLIVAEPSVREKLQPKIAQQLKARIARIRPMDEHGVDLAMAHELRVGVDLLPLMNEACQHIVAFA